MTSSKATMRQIKRERSSRSLEPSTRYQVLLLIFRNFRIHAIRPGCNSTRQVAHLFESGLLQERDRLRATPSHFAMDDDLSAGIQLVHPLRQIVQRDQV